MKNHFLHEAYRLISPVQRKKGLWVVLLLIISSVLDFFSLAFFLPVVFLLIDAKTVESNAYFERVYHALGFSSVRAFAVTFVCAVFFFILLKTVANGWIAKRKAIYAYRIGSEMALRAVGRYLRLPYVKFAQTELSQEVNLISNIPLIFANNIIIPAGTLLAEVLIFILLLGGVAIYNVKVFGFLSMILIPAFLIYRLRRIKLKQIGERLRSLYPTLLKFTLVIVEGLPDILSFRKEAHYKKEFEKVGRELTGAFSTDHAIHSGTPRVTEALAAGCVCAMIVYALMNQSDPQKTLMLLSVYAAASFRIIPSVNRIIGAVQHMKVHEYSVREFSKIMNEKRAEPAPHTNEKFHFRDKIVLRDVSFGYPGRDNVLNKIDLTIRKGEKIALTGKSGVGKSTLLLLLLGFLDEQHGEIQIDGQTWPGASRRSILGYVSQHPYIMDGSVEENIAFGVYPQDIDRARITRLIKEMDLEDWVSSLPEGVHTRIGEKGARISGGQRQRLAIARVLYHDADVLLLDEVTNQLDPGTEKEVSTTLLRLSDQSKTLVMITHHPELLKQFEMVYELSSGKLDKVKARISETTIRS